MTTLEAWGTEIGGRCHSVFLVCARHSPSTRQAAVTLRAAGSLMLHVRLEQLDAVFAGEAYRCFACELGDQPGRGTPAEITQAVVHGAGGKGHN